MKVNNPKTERRNTIRRRIRSKISGTSDRPRFSVFKSNKHIYAQLIDDKAGHTMVAMSTLDAELREQIADMTATEKAEAVGKKLGENAKQAGIEQVVFDRSGYYFHGKVKAVAEGARASGLKF